eukprot:3935144-Rhodomonas_salina.1
MRVSTLAALLGSSELLALDGVARSSVLNASRSARADPLSEAAGPLGASVSPSPSAASLSFLSLSRASSTAVCSASSLEAKYRMAPRKVARTEPVPERRLEGAMPTKQHMQPLCSALRIETSGPHEAAIVDGTMETSCMKKKSCEKRPAGMRPWMCASAVVIANSDQSTSGRYASMRTVSAVDKPVMSAALSPGEKTCAIIMAVQKQLAIPQNPYHHACVV